MVLEIAFFSFASDALSLFAALSRAIRALATDATCPIDLAFAFAAATGSGAALEILERRVPGDELSLPDICGVR